MSSHGPRQPYKIDNTGIENRDVNYGSLFRMITFMFIFLGISAAITWPIWKAFVPKQSVIGEATALPQEERVVAPDPKLQPFPKTEMKVFWQEEDAKVNSYTYLDKNTGKVRIPVARALELVAQEGLPVASKQPAQDPSKPNALSEPSLQTPPPDVDVNRRILPSSASVPGAPAGTAPGP